MHTDCSRPGLSLEGKWVATQLSCRSMLTYTYHQVPYAVTAASSAADPVAAGRAALTPADHPSCCRCHLPLAAAAAAVRQALKMTGSTLGKSSLRVLPSKTAIVPVNKELMPRSEEELERCSRTVYVANIDKKVEREDVRVFFDKLCGELGRGWGPGAVCELRGRL